MAVAVAPKKKPAPPSKRHPMTRFRYGCYFDPLLDPQTKKAMCPIPDWKIEAKMYLNCTEERHPPGWLGKAEHFRRMISIIWASPLAKRPFQWNPNASRIVDEYFSNTYLGIAGHASSSKSETVSVIALAEFIADPENTAVLVTSTTIPEARGRVWGRVEFLWQDCVEYFAALGQHMGFKCDPPGELVSSSAMIRYKLGGRKDDTRGIKLVPGKESEVKEGIGRMKGFKAKRLRFLADELSDLSHKLLDAAESNLFVNEDFKMVGCYNPASHFDPAGVFSEPEGGWGSINVSESDGWKTKRGYCIRFDGVCSPNVVAGHKVWEGLLTLDKLDEARKNLGDNSPRFLQQYRGTWALTGAEDCIYSEAEIIKYRGMTKVDVWTAPKVKAAGFDPSFVHDGDRAALTIGDCAEAVCFESKRVCAEVDQVVYLDDNIDTSQDKKEFIVARLKQECIKHKIDPKNLAMDATGGGEVLATLMSRDPFFGTKFLKVQFGGSGSELMSGGRKGKDRFANMASELWYSGKPLLRTGQIRGLTPDIVREMTLRLYEEASGGKKQIKIEPKKDMKARLNGRSPDAADSCMLFFYLCRARLGLRSPEAPAKSAKPVSSGGPIDDMFSWGLKKKPQINEVSYVPSGGGWGDDETIRGF